MAIADTVRGDFPLLTKHPELVYFDSACMSLKPQQVLEAMDAYYTDMSACAGRSNHRLAAAVSEATEEARESVQRLIGAKRADQVVFTRNTSEGINLVAHGLKLEEGDVVLTSDKEHNSNLVPWLKLRDEAGIIHTIIPSKQDNTFDMEAFEELLTHEVKLVALVHVSNLDGVTFPIEDVIKRAHEVGAKVLVDGAQSVPHQRIDVEDLGVDFLAFSVHKMLGPTGMGVLYAADDLFEAMHPFMVGGDTVVKTTYDTYELLPAPEKYEAGLQDYAGIIGAGAAAEYLMGFAMDEVHEHEVSLNEKITRALDDMDRVSIIGPAEASMRGGIVSFTVEGADHHQVALMLDKTSQVMVRSGQHCVHSWFDAHDLPGSVRASLYLYNTQEEAERFVEGVQKVMAVV